MASNRCNEFDEMTTSATTTIATKLAPSLMETSSHDDTLSSSSSMEKASDQQSHPLRQEKTTQTKCNLVEIQRSSSHQGEDEPVTDKQDYTLKTSPILRGRIPRRMARRHLPRQSPSSAEHVVVVSSSSKSSSSTRSSASVVDFSSPPPYKRQRSEPATTAARTTTSALVQDDSVNEADIPDVHSAAPATVATPAASTQLQTRSFSNKNKTSVPTTNSQRMRGHESSPDLNKTVMVTRMKSAGSRVSANKHEQEYSTYNTPFRAAMEQFEKAQDEEEDAGFLGLWKSPRSKAKKKSKKTGKTSKKEKADKGPRKRRNKLYEEDFVYEVDPNPISNPRNTDVLFGRGSAATAWPGNAKFRNFCLELRPDYDRAYRLEKQLVAQQVVQLVQSQLPPGRFLVPVGDVYRQADEDEAVEKACQNLRERKEQKNKTLKTDEMDPISIPRQTDVLVRSDNGSSSLPGNSLFREICRSVCHRYQKATHRTTRQRIVRQVVQLVHGQDPPARFVVREGGVYKKAPQGEVLEKIRLALRVQKPPKERPHKRKRLQERLSYEVDPTPISIPRKTDVLFGRGSAIATWPGNEKYRDFCWDVREDYGNAPRQERHLVAERVVHLVQAQEPPGRFLIRVGGVYRQAEEDEVVEKICQALRERRAHKLKRLNTEVVDDDQVDPNAMLIPRKTDVMLGPDSDEAVWPGNTKFRDVCCDLRQAYQRADRTEKRLIARQVVQMVQAEDPPGRFLVREGDIYKQAEEDEVLKEICDHLQEESLQTSKIPKHQLFDFDQVDPNPDIVPGETDILFVQGTEVAAWPGNTKFRQFCQRFCQRYYKANRTEKLFVAQQVMQLVQAEEPPGRFLVQESGDLYRRASEEEALDKICQAVVQERTEMQKRAQSPVLIPRKTDVLFGQSVDPRDFPGNARYRDFCWNIREDYIKAPRREKQSVALRVVHEVQRQIPPGRFLVREGGAYAVESEDKVVQKITDYLRRQKPPKSEGHQQQKLPEKKIQQKSAPQQKRPPTELVDKADPNSIPVLRHTDVLFGRQHMFYQGNTLFREICWGVHHRYQKASNRTEKQRVARQVVKLVQQQDPPGRFLVQEGDVYYSAPQEEVMEKIYQVLAKQQKKPQNQQLPQKQETVEEPAVYEYKVDPNPISVPRNTDVLFGRGTGISTFPGNAKYREICWDVREDYREAHRTDKRLVAQRVVQLVQNQNPPGRFLVREGEVYKQAEEEKVVEKISQALREQKWYR